MVYVKVMYSWDSDLPREWPHPRRPGGGQSGATENFRRAF